MMKHLWKTIFQPRMEWTGEGVTATDKRLLSKVSLKVELFILLEDQIHWQVHICYLFPRKQEKSSRIKQKQENNRGAYTIHQWQHTNVSFTDYASPYSLHISMLLTFYIYCYGNRKTSLNSVSLKNKCS